MGQISTFLLFRGGDNTLEDSAGGSSGNATPAMYVGDNDFLLSYNGVMRQGLSV